MSNQNSNLQDSQKIITELERPLQEDREGSPAISSSELNTQTNYSVTESKNACDHQTIENALEERRMSSQSSNNFNLNEHGEIVESQALTAFYHGIAPDLLVIANAIQELKTEAINRMLSEIEYLRKSNNKLLELTKNLQREMNILKSVVSPISSTDDLQEIEEEKMHLAALRKALIMRLRVLELRRANQGIQTSADIDIEIKDIRDQIRATEARTKIVISEINRLNVPAPH